MTSRNDIGLRLRSASQFMLFQLMSMVAALLQAVCLGISVVLLYALLSNDSPPHPDVDVIDSSTAPTLERSVDAKSGGTTHGRIQTEGSAP